LGGRKVEIRKITGKARPGHKSETLFQKCLTEKRAGGVAQVLEHMLSKYEALSTNIRSTHKKNVMCKGE
jgi:hypothetical protein